MLVATMRDRVERGRRARPGIGEERVRLGGRPGLRGDDDQRPERVEVVERRRDVGRIGRIEDAQGEVAVEDAERLAEDVGGEAAAAHPGHHRGRVTLVDDRVAEPLQPGDPLREVGRRVKPAEPLGDRLADARIARPQADVPREQPVRPLVGPGQLDGRLVVGCAGAKGEPGRGEGRRRWIGHRWASGGWGRPWYAGRDRARRRVRPRPRPRQHVGRNRK